MSQDIIWLYQVFKITFYKVGHDHAFVFLQIRIYNHIFNKKEVY